MTDINFVVDESKCIHCGLCKKDCISKIIKMDDNKNPFIKNSERCIKCGHCIAVCPVGAISILNKKPEDSEQIYVQNPDMVLNLIKSRRSIRHYKNENVDKQTLDKLKDMVKWVPTGVNAHKLHFSFIEDVDVMNELRGYVNNKILRALTKKPIKAVTEKFAPYLNALERGDDIIFRGAPHMVVVSNSIKAPCANEDSIIALSYFELYAQSLGLGTCWCGYAHMVIKMFPELCDYFGIPEGYQAGYVMLFGNKDINYSRTTQPEECEITIVDKGNIEKISAGKAAKRYFWNFIR